MFPKCQASAPTHIVAASGPFGTPWTCLSQCPQMVGAGLVTWRAGSARPAHQEYDLWVPLQHRMEGQTGTWSLWRPGSCPAHGHRGTRLEGQQPLPTQRSAGPLTSRTFLCQTSGLGMSAGRVATRPWASKTQCLPHRQKASSARHYPCQDTGSAELTAAFYNKWKPGSELTQPPF